MAVGCDKSVAEHAVATSTVSYQAESRELKAEAESLSATVKDIGPRSHAIPRNRPLQLSVWICVWRLTNLREACPRFAANRPLMWPGSVSLVGFFKTVMQRRLALVLKEAPRACQRPCHRSKEKDDDETIVDRYRDELVPGGGADRFGPWRRRALEAGTGRLLLRRQ
jgi:hypothetical protein